MRKCYVCQQMKAVVLVAKKPDGKRGYICSTCHEDSVNDWYYWSKNKYAHFIRFRIQDNQVATAKVIPLTYACGSCETKFEWKVNGPCWSAYEETGMADDLNEAKEAVNKRVMAIIEREFEPESVHPMG